MRSTKRWMAGAALALTVALTGACGGGDDEGNADDAAATTDATDAGGDGGDGATPTTAAAATAGTGSACDSLTDEELASVFGGPATKEEAAGGSCTVKSADGAVFATVKFESGSLDNARETIEESFEVPTRDESFGEGAFSFERSGVVGVMVVQGGKLANVAGNFDVAKGGALALAMLNS